MTGFFQQLGLAEQRETEDRSTHSPPAKRSGVDFSRLLPTKSDTPSFVPLPFLSARRIFAPNLSTHV